MDKRLNHLVLESAQTLSECKQLSIFGLGRALKRNAYVKHNIKTIDRLFGSPALAKKGHVYYEDCARWLVGNNKRPFILVDWSGLTRCGEFHFLRASIPVGGRALPILDMSFRLKDYGSNVSHKRFMEKLKSIFPKDCKPIIVTDAGFRFLGPCQHSVKAVRTYQHQVPRSIAIFDSNRSSDPDNHPDFFCAYLLPP